MDFFYLSSPLSNITTMVAFEALCVIIKSFNVATTASNICGGNTTSNTVVTLNSAVTNLNASIDCTLSAISKLSRGNNALTATLTVSFQAGVAMILPAEMNYYGTGRDKLW